MPRYVVTVRFETAATHRDAFRIAMGKQAANSLAHEPGCHQFDVCYNDDTPDTCFLYETYTDRAAFDLHLASNHFKSFDTLVSPWIVSKKVETWTLAPSS